MNVDKMIKEFEKREKEFTNALPPNEIKLVNEIQKIIEAIDKGDNGKGFGSWTGERLVQAREKLSRLSEPLGDNISSHESLSDFAYIWRKGAYASDWLPIKTELSEGLKKPATITDIETKLTEKYIEEQYYSTFHRRRADFLIRKLEAVDRIIRSIDSRIRELERQAHGL